MVNTLILASVIILCCILFSKISDKIGLPMLLVFIVLGMLFGSDGIFKIPFDNYRFAEDICTIALIIIIFYGGFGTKWSEAKEVAVKSLLLSSLGVILTAVLTGLFCHLCLHFDLIEGLLLGAVISSTDAASVFSVLRSKQLNLKYKTASVLELESGGNDPWAYMLTVIILSVMHGGGSVGSFVQMLLAQIVLGLTFGIAIAAAAIFILRKIRLTENGFDAIFVLSIAILSYAIPAAFNGNGYLSAYLVGIILGNTKITNKKALVHFFDGITGLLQMLIFFLLGLLAFPSQIPRILLAAIAITLFLTIIARPLSVFFIMKPFKASLQQLAVISWAGLRGATSIVFAIMATIDTAYTGNDIFHIVFCIVLLSIGIQGTLLPKVAEKFNMIDNDENVMKTFNDYSDDVQIQFIRLNIKENSGWANKKLNEITLPPNVLIALILRNNERIIPSGKTKIMAGDTVVLSAEGFYDDSSFILSELTVTKDHVWCNKTLSEISTPDDCLIIMIKRNGRTLIPDGSMMIKNNDILVMTANTVCN